VIDQDKVRDRITFLRGNLEILRDLAQTPRVAFTERSMEFHAAVRLLQTSIEAMIDIAGHIVAREGLGSPKSYVEVFDLLGRSGAIAPEFLDRLRSMVRFRNRAVHLYADIDVSHVYGILREDLGDLEAFIELIVARYFV